MMKLSLYIAVFLLVLGVFGCGGSDSTSGSAANLQDAAKKQEQEIQSLWDRKGEFATMKPPLKPQKQYFVKTAFVMFKIPGTEYEVLGWEKDASGKMTVCGFDKCNDRNVSFIKSYLPKEGKASTLIRADCKAGKKLGDLELVAIGVGALYESDCEMTVVDLDTNTTVASERIVTEKPKTGSGDTIDDKLLIASVDKRSKYVVPMKEISDLIHSLSIEKKK